ncbi:PREDICTED: mediator of RNA polymerase II transcription subunit 18 [Charadrius vociferus]|uniref:mediator of RNA polymerase II transcription subunit 18 n=1 Tax=Charadrius vociferus TaxID=50402 RepID=UPI0005217198|nr:PREDICTED: mediator of RNA polymerase II transcription subunit 18 [Charadrius vociferus]
MSLPLPQVPQHQPDPSGCPDPSAAGPSPTPAHRHRANRDTSDQDFPQNFTRSPFTAWEAGGEAASPFVLRARRSMDKSGMPWHLRYLGQPEIGDKNRHALVRNCVDIATSDNLTDFLVEMGFRMDHEFVAKGHVFRKGIMKIVVYKIFRILMPGNTESIEPLSLSYLVELNVVAPAGQDVVSDDMRNFAEQLKPLVHLEKIDPKRLM